MKSHLYKHKAPTWKTKRGHTAYLKSGPRVVKGGLLEDCWLGVLQEWHMLSVHPSAPLHLPRASGRGGGKSNHI